MVYLPGFTDLYGLGHEKILLFIFYLAVGLQLVAQGDVSQARWQAAGVVTDGNNSEWKKPLNLYDAITGLLFTIANDSTNLYLCFTDNDERKITKLMKAGWSIEILSKEKNKKTDALLVFPAVQMIPAPGKDGGVTQSELPGFKNETALYRLALQSVTSKGFATNNGNIPLLNKGGINIGLGADSSQAIVFEFAIPFSELFAGNQLMLNEEMALHITVHALKKPARQVRTTSSTSPLNGSGRKNAIKDAYPVDRSLLYTEIDFKQRFRLANK